MLTCRDISLEDDFDWERLISDSNTASFFQTKDWLKLWMEHFGGEAEILGVFDGNNLVGIAPLLIKKEKISFLGITNVLGNELVSDFGDIIAKKGREKEVWEIVLDVILRTSNASTPESIREKDSGQDGYRTVTRQARMTKVLELNFVTEDSPSFHILKRLGGKVEAVDTAPYIDLPRSWEDYLGSLDRHDRHELRRKMRRLDEEGAIKIYYQGEEDDIEEFIRLMSLSNEQKRNFLSPKMQSFFKEIISIFYPLKRLELCFLRLSGENIAATLSFVFNNEVLLYNSGFNQKYAYLSPGLLLKSFLIKEAIEKRRTRFEFLRGGERYKYDLGAKERKLYKISL